MGRSGDSLPGSAWFLNCGITRIAVGKHRGSLGHYRRSCQELPVPRDPENARRFGRLCMTCDSVTKLIPLYYYGDLTPEEEDLFDQHLDRKSTRLNSSH